MPARLLLLLLAGLIGMGAVIAAYFAFPHFQIRIHQFLASGGELSYQVKKGETVTYNVMAKGLNALTDGPVTLTFYPDLQYSEFNANWELTADALKSAT